jgi:intracellular septation protein
MKFLFDFFPLLVFFGAFKWGGANAELATNYINAHLSGIISGGSITADLAPMIVATIAGVAATAAQIGYLLARGRKVDTILWISLLLFVFFGGLTIYFHDENLIKWKLTIFYWGSAITLSGAQLIFKKNLMRKSMEAIMQLPDPIWQRLNLIWISFFTFMGFLNLYVAFVLFKGDTAAWVSFKAFGSTAIMFVFIIGQTFYLSKHMKEEA